MPCSLCNHAGHNNTTCPTRKPSVETPLTDTPDISFIRTLATEILDTLGAGHTEYVYHNAMKVGLHDANIKFETERDIVIRFRDRYVGTVRADLIIENRLVIELKSSSGADAAVADALDQCRIYMKETGVSSGVVVVFPKRVGGKLIISIA